MRWAIINWLETTKHRLWVAWYLLKTCFVILRRAWRHDLSKYGLQERYYFETALPKLRGLDYGSDDYKAALEMIEPAIQHHYYSNSHHPEHWLGGFDDMSPLDRIEMICDWKAATRRHTTGNIEKSFEINRDRFNIPEIQLIALKRDAFEIGVL